MAIKAKFVRQTSENVLLKYETHIAFHKKFISTSGHQARNEHLLAIETMADTDADPI